MIHLIYVSSATREMSEEDLLFLLDQSRERNLRQHITGMLLFVGGTFIQVLEGDEKDVEEIYESILNDDRNSANILMVKEEISERAFPDWSMGFENISRNNRDQIKGYSDFLDIYMTPAEVANSSGTAIKLLYSFKKSNI